MSITLPPGRFDRKRVRVAPGPPEAGRKPDPLPFAENKSRETDSEADEDMELWDQTVDEEPLPAE